MSQQDHVSDTDVIVIGTGAAGLAAALSARHAGADVLVLERSEKLGGTTAISGGVPWIPCNHHMHEVGSSDTREAALTYLRRQSLGRMDDEMIETYVDAGVDVIKFIEAETDIRFRALQWPDYHPELPGGTFGRSLSAGLFPGNDLGELRPRLRSSLTFPIPISSNDLEDGVDIFDPAIIGDRLEKGLVGVGNALVAGLTKAVVHKGATILFGMRAQSLIMDEGAVVGVRGDHDGVPFEIRARRGVIIASGGFEWNAALVKDLLRGPHQGAASPPDNQGDGLLMAAEAGAALANTDEAWWMPIMKIPGEEYDGQPAIRFAVTELTKPGSIMVNRAGQRFVNESCNYNDLGRSFFQFDAQTFDYPNQDAWIIFHQGYLDRYPVMTRYPGDPLPNWIEQAPTLAALADRIGVDPAGLERTVEQFNMFARDGRDPAFHRGESRYDRYHGDWALEGSHQTVGVLDQAPFYACRVYPGVLGTKGGPKISARAEVQSLRGGKIAGLYAAGNAAASITGMAYPGAGGTIGPALVFGHIAGREAATRTNRR